MQQAVASQNGYINNIPVQNLWLLMLYASDLRHELINANRNIEENPEDIADLVAQLLAYLAERQLRRHLSFGYRNQSAVLTRVRGRIDVLTTTRHRLLQQGRVFCDFEELTIDTPLNQYIKSALYRVSKIVHDRSISTKCKSLARTFEKLGVGGDVAVNLRELAIRAVPKNKDDRRLFALANLAFHLLIPAEEAGKRHPFSPDRTNRWIYELYEKAIRGFFEVNLICKGWKVASRNFAWDTQQTSERINEILPKMRTDIVLVSPEQHTIIIDTKFTEIIKVGSYGRQTLASGHIYQIYAYLRSQEETDPSSKNTTGILLHPAVNEKIDEYAFIQGHKIRFATVNLAANAAEIKKRLLDIAQEEAGIDANAKT